MKKTLIELKNAINGTVVMSLALEKMFDSFLLRKVPELWENVAYPSLKPLGSWVSDLIARIQFMKEWSEKDNISSYWVSAFFFP